MNADRLLANFNTLVDTPGAVPRLRRFILDLSVRGKLIPQDQTDEPAAKLLNRIAIEKMKLLSDNGRKPTQRYSDSQQSELPFGLPSGWSEARFADVIIGLQTGPFGSSLHQSDYKMGGTPVVNPASMQDGKIVPLDKMAVGGATLERLAQYKLEVGDIVMARRGEMGRCSVVTEQERGWLCGTGSLIVRVPTCINESYLAMLMRSSLVRDYLNSSAVGATMQNLNQSILLRVNIGLPPLAEQHRIVAKVDELMTLCNRLEEARQELEAARDRFATTSLARLSSPDPDLPTFHADAAFAIENFDRITARADQVAALRRTILDLAVRGRLVPQDPTDEPAQELLKRVAEERDRLKKIGKMRKTPAGKLAMVRAPFSLPDTWRWAALGDVFAYDVGIKRESNAMDPSLWLLELQDVERNTGSLLVRVTAAERETKSTKSEFRTGDILYGKLRPYLNKVLVAEERGYSTTEIVALRPYIPLCGRYCSLALRQRDFVDYVTHVGQGTKMPRLRTKDAIVAPFPLPPLAEQHRIVAKADELMTWCDRLEERLVTTEDARRGLLDAVLNEAVESNTCGHAMAATASVAVA